MFSVEIEYNFGLGWSSHTVKELIQLFLERTNMKMQDYQKETAILKLDQILAMRSTRQKVV